jgi:assimilatory nitrate reductase catalytic subunit
VQALAACPLVIVSEVSARTDTGAFAHIRFRRWRGEKNGTVTNSSGVFRASALSAAAGEAKADWWIIARWRNSWAGEAFAWQHPQSFCEHAALWV